MKYIKMLGLAAVAVAALMAFVGAGTASASVLCSATPEPSGACPAGQKWPATTPLSFSLKAKTSAKLVDTEGSTLDTCTGSTVAGEVEKAGSSSEAVTGPVTSLGWSGCTFTTDTTQLSKLEGGYTSGDTGTLTADGEFKVTINTVLFGSCVYGVTAGTALGVVHGGAKEVATFVANAVAKKLSGSNVACPETSKWTAEYVSTGSTTAYLAAS